MSIYKLLQGGAFAALAVAIAPADVAAREEGEQRSAMQIRGERVQQANAQRQEQRAQRAEQRAQLAERHTDQQPAQAAPQGDRAPSQAAPQQNWQRGRQADRSGERPARTEQRGEQAARQLEQRGDQAARQAEQRTQWRTGQAQPTERNRSYADPGRDRSYAANDNRRGTNAWQDGRRDGDGRNDSAWRGDRRDTDNNWAHTGRSGNDRRWDNRWRDNDRYDWQRYRSSHRSLYNLGAYYAPYRYYSYRPFGVGSHLNSLFFGSSYWITNPWQYRLPEVWGPYRWVRYYDDVLLVDIYTGQVVDVIHNFFW